MPKLERVLLGTSPFIGAGQFGPRALRYLEQFLNAPERILKLIELSFQLGVKGIQLLPYPHVVSALELFLERNPRIQILGTLMPNSPQSCLELLAELESEFIALHGAITDSWDLDSIKKLISCIRAQGCIPGAATHAPNKLLSQRWLAGLDLEFVMFPLNKQGIFMDADPDSICAGFRQLGLKLVAKKPLGAGSIDPESGLEFVARYADSVTIGIASEQEAKQSFPVALKFFR